MTSRPWVPQDLIDDMQDIINEEPDNYLNTRRTTLQMALAYLQEYFDRHSWIPVSERLPDHEDAVLCFIKNGQQDILQFDKFENLWVGMQWTYKRHAVTHWMPLPEPPKEGE
jgi:hypothetical protein